MNASSCINREIPFLQPEDKGLTALSLLEELKVSEMPLVDGDRYMGLITELDLLDYECIEGKLSDLNAELKNPFVYDDDHLFDVVGKIAAESLSILPVITREEKYLGCTDTASALQFVAKAEAYHSPGGVLQLEIGTHDYTMSEIARIAESNDAKILYSYVTSSGVSGNIQLTLKFNQSNLSRIIQTFDRFGYKITASFQQEEFEKDLRKRYESFLRYLNI